MLKKMFKIIFFVFLVGLLISPAWSSDNIVIDTDRNLILAGSGGGDQDRDQDRKRDESCNDLAPYNPVHPLILARGGNGGNGGGGGHGGGGGGDQSRDRDCDDGDGPQPEGPNGPGT
ncbi:hypothetical protein ACFL03_00215 [Thermodesulfobacteriota bacterium]